MSITDELRKVAAKTECANGRCEKLYRGDLEHIADRIDAEHERELRETGEDIVRDVRREWVRLPLDADGVPIRVGDVMEFSAFEIEKPVTRMVDGIGQGVFFAWCGERGYQQHEAKRYRHHHAPTVEDVLREFAEKITDSQVPGVHPTYEEAIAEYAAKLRLAGDGE